MRLSLQQKPNNISNNLKVKMTMEKKQLVIGIGEALFDMLPEGKKLGGAPANFAYHVSQFGLESYAVSAMGDDELGKELEKELNDHHLNYQIEKVAYPTGTVQVSLDANGIPCYDIKEGAAWDNIPYTPALEKLAKNCTAACFGSLAQRNEVSRKPSTVSSTICLKEKIFSRFSTSICVRVSITKRLSPKASSDAIF